MNCKPLLLVLYFDLRSANNSALGWPLSDLHIAVFALFRNLWPLKCKTRLTIAVFCGCQSLLIATKPWNNKSKQNGSKLKELGHDILSHCFDGLNYSKSVGTRKSNGFPKKKTPKVSKAKRKKDGWGWRRLKRNFLGTGTNLFWHSLQSTNNDRAIVPKHMLNKQKNLATLSILR